MAQPPIIDHRADDAPSTLWAWRGESPPSNMVRAPSASARTSRCPGGGAVLIRSKAHGQPEGGYPEDRPARRRSELVGTDDFAPGAGGEGAEDLGVDRLLEEPHRPVAEHKVAPAGVQAPEVVGGGKLAVGHDDPRIASGRRRPRVG